MGEVYAYSGTLETDEDPQSGTVTIILKDNHLIQFPELIQRCEEDNCSRGKGVFKGRLDAREVRATSAAELLHHLNSVMSNSYLPEEQRFHAFSSKFNLYTYASCQAVSDSMEARAFANALTTPTNFCSDVIDTCCSKMLVDEGDVKGLLDHYWKFIREISTPAMNVVEDYDDTHVQNMLSAGEEMRKIFEGKCGVLLNKEGVSLRNERPVRNFSLQMLETKHPWTSVRNEVKKLYESVMISRRRDSTANKVEKKRRVPRKGGKKGVALKNRRSKTEGVKEPEQQQKPKEDNCIIYGAGLHLPEGELVFITKNFSLSNLNTLLSIHPDKYAGLSQSFFYVGTCHSTFPLHIEDASLWSVNFLHYGAIKVWIVIPPDYVHYLSLCLYASRLLLEHTSCRNVLGHKCAVVDTTFLDFHEIPYTVVLQHPGEFVFLHPNAAHFGFNLGYNIAEAANFATKSWILHGLYSPKCGCYGLRQVHLDMAPYLAMYYPSLLDDYLHGKLFSYLTPSRGKPATTILHKLQVEEEKVDMNVGHPQPERKDEEEVDPDDPSPVIMGKPARHHTATISERLLLECVVCDKVFQGGRGKLIRLINHCKKKHSTYPDIEQLIMSKYPPKVGKMEKTLVCPTCGFKGAGTPANLRRHIFRKHRTEKHK